MAEQLLYKVEGTTYNDLLTGIHTLLSNISSVKGTVVSSTEISFVINNDARSIKLEDVTDGISVYVDDYYAGKVTVDSNLYTYITYSENTLSIMSYADRLKHTNFTSIGIIGKYIFVLKKSGKADNGTTILYLNSANIWNSVSKKNCGCYFSSPEKTDMFLPTGISYSNELNEIAEIYPLNFYIQDTPQVLNKWCYVGTTDAIGIVNMRNMANRHISQVDYPTSGSKYACFSVEDRREKGYNYDGVAFKLTTRTSKTEDDSSVIPSVQ